MIPVENAILPPEAVKRYWGVAKFNGFPCLLPSLVLLSRNVFACEACMFLIIEKCHFSPRSRYKTLRAAFLLEHVCSVAKYNGYF